MVNATGNQNAASCRNDLPVASKNGVQLIISSTDMKVKCRNILLPLRRELSGVKPRGVGEGGSKGRADLTVCVKREISSLTDPTKTGSEVGM